MDCIAITITVFVCLQKMYRHIKLSGTGQDWDCHRNMLRMGSAAPAGMGWEREKRCGSGTGMGP